MQSTQSKISSACINAITLIFVYQLYVSSKVLKVNIYITTRVEKVKAKAIL